MKIIFALDPFSFSDTTVQAVANRPWPPDTFIRVLSVVRQLPPSAAELWFDSGGDIRAVCEFRKARALESAKKAADILCSSGLSAEPTVFEGSPKKVIINQAKEWGADLIIVSPHRRRIAGWVPAGLVAAVLNHAPCSVEVLRSRGAAFGISAQASADVSQAEHI